MTGRTFSISIEWKTPASPNSNAPELRGNRDERRFQARSLRTAR